MLAALADEAWRVLDLSGARRVTLQGCLRAAPQLLPPHGGAGQLPQLQVLDISGCPQLCTREALGCLAAGLAAGVKLLRCGERTVREGGRLG